MAMVGQLWREIGLSIVEYIPTGKRADCYVGLLSCETQQRPMGKGLAYARPFVCMGSILSLVVDLR